MSKRAGRKIFGALGAGSLAAVAAASLLIAAPVFGFGDPLPDFALAVLLWAAAAALDAAKKRFSKFAA
ncbi:MAG: hypothetical protein ACFWTZ_09275 [Burkholderia sp.]|jgi:hypothetical protein